MDIDPSWSGALPQEMVKERKTGAWSGGAAPAAAEAIWRHRAAHRLGGSPRQSGVPGERRRRLKKYYEDLHLQQAFAGSRHCIRSPEISRVAIKRLLDLRFTRIAGEQFFYPFRKDAIDQI